MSIAAQEPIWVPGREDVESAHLTHYMRWLAGRGLAPAGLTYEQLWRWSVEDLDRFWSSLWDYFDIMADGTATAVRTGAMPNVRWFPGTELSFAEHVLRNHRDGTAILDARETEDGDVEIARRVSWDELASEVARIAGVLTDLGVRPGDHVVGYLPNIPEAFVASLGGNQHRCDLVGVRTGLLRRLGSIPIRTARTGRPHRCRRLPLRRQDPRPPR